MSKINIKLDFEEGEELHQFLEEGKHELRLPAYVQIPKGSRSKSERAEFLMRIGLEQLKSQFGELTKLQESEKSSVPSHKFTSKNESDEGFFR